MKFSKTTGLAILFVIAGCETSGVDQENPDTLPTADSPASPQEDVREPIDELERTDLLSESRALEVAKNLVIAREGWPNARCVSTRKQNAWSILISRRPRERFADDVIVEVSREGEVVNYRYAR